MDIQQMHANEQIEELIQDTSFYTVGTTGETRERFRTLPKSDIFKKVQQELQALPYKPFVKFDYIEEYTNNLEKLERVRRPSLATCLREQDKPIIVPLLQYLGMEKWINRNPIALAQVPDKIKCVDCESEYPAPFYYFFTSKVYRCVACAEMESADPLEKMLKYRAF